MSKKIYFLSLIGFAIVFVKNYYLGLDSFDLIASGAIIGVLVCYHLALYYMRMMEKYYEAKIKDLEFKINLLEKTFTKKKKKKKKREN